MVFFFVVRHYPKKDTTGCPVDFASIGKRDHSCNFFSNGLPLNTFRILISHQMEALEFLKNLENWKNFYLGEKGWSKSNLEQLLPPTPWIFVFSFFHSFVDFTTKTASKTSVLIVFNNFQCIGVENLWNLWKKSRGWEAAIDPNSILTTFFHQSRIFFIF